MANLQNKSQYLKVFDPPPQTDPKDDFDSFIQQKIISIKKYAERPDRNDNYLKRQIAEIQELQSIYDKFDNLKLYSEWVKIENTIQNHSNDGDGITIQLPFVLNAKRERFINLDLCK